MRLFLCRGQGVIVIKLSRQKINQFSCKEEKSLFMPELCCDLWSFWKTPQGTETLREYQYNTFIESDLSLESIQVKGLP